MARTVCGATLGAHCDAKAAIIAPDIVTAENMQMSSLVASRAVGALPDDERSRTPETWIADMGVGRHMCTGRATSATTKYRKSGSTSQKFAAPMLRERLPCRQSTLQDINCSAVIANVRRRSIGRDIVMKISGVEASVSPRAWTPFRRR